MKTEKIMKTYNDNLFSYGHYLANLAANYSYIQLKNPTGSGVIVAVHSIMVAIEQAGSRIAMRSYGTNLSGTFTALNHRFGGAAPSAQYRYEQRGDNPGTSWCNAMCVLANTPIKMLQPADYPVILIENQGILIRPNSQNQGISCWFIWEEF